MRLGILAFAAGILLLQQQAVLPPMLAVAGQLAQVRIANLHTHLVMDFAKGIGR